MPYGLPKAKGGDSASNVAWMKRCVSDVTGKGTPKLNAILICKAQFSRKKTK